MFKKRGPNEKVREREKGVEREREREREIERERGGGGMEVGEYHQLRLIPYRSGQSFPPDKGHTSSAVLSPKPIKPWKSRIPRLISARPTDVIRTGDAWMELLFSTTTDMQAMGSDSCTVC